MDNTACFALFGVAMVFHLPLAFFTGKEILRHPFWSNPKKTGWLVFTVLVPFIGFRMVHKKLNLRIRGGGTGGEDTYTCGGD